MKKINNNHKTMNYGPYVKNLRETAGFPQDFVAKKLGMSRPTYILIEKGRRELGIEEVKTLTELFGLSLEEFFSLREAAKIDIKKRLNVKKASAKPEVRISVPQERLDKFKEALLYILKKIGAKPNVGEAVLCKLFYFIDFDYYEKFEEQLIGAVYIKNHFGPTPIEFPSIVKQMEAGKELVKITGKYFNYDQKKYLPLRDPDLSLFTIKELQTIDEVLARLSDKTAAEMKAYSHDDVPYITAEDGKPIDYESVFYRTPAYSVRNYDGDEL
jgi:transcriptional regulator with XRE-family HTH domain